MAKNQGKKVIKALEGMTSINNKTVQSVEHALPVQSYVEVDHVRKTVQFKIQEGDPAIVGVNGCGPEDLVAIAGALLNEKNKK